MSESSERRYRRQAVGFAVAGLIINAMTLPMCIATRDWSGLAFFIGTASICTALLIFNVRALRRSP